jgi:hypothetical protein
MTRAPSSRKAKRMKLLAPASSAARRGSLERDQTEAPARTQAHARYNRRSELTRNGGREITQKLSKILGRPTSSTNRPSNTRVIGSSAICTFSNNVMSLCHCGHNIITRSHRSYPPRLETYVALPFVPAREQSRKPSKYGQGKSIATTNGGSAPSRGLALSDYRKVIRSASSKNTSVRSVGLHQPTGLFL